MRACLRTLGTAAALAGCLLLTSCGGDAPVEQPAASPTPAQPAAAPSADAPAGGRLQVVDVAGLPQVNDPITTRSEPPIEVAFPEGWQVLPPAEGFIARSRINAAAEYPRIYVQVEDWSGPATADPEALDSFVQSVRQKLGSKTLTSPAAPIRIGAFAGASYADLVSAGGSRIARQFVCTSHEGRLYTLELRAREGTEREFLPELHTVAAHLEFDPQPDDDLPLGGQAKPVAE